MSLPPPAPSSPEIHGQEVICIDSDGEDDVQHTAGPSRASSVKSNQKPSAQHPSLNRSVSPQQPQNKSTIGLSRGSALAGLSTSERSKMEQDRIARAKQRTVEAPASPVRVTKSIKRGIDEAVSPGRSNGTRGVSIRPTKTQRTEEVLPKSFYGGGSTTGSQSPDSGGGARFKKSEPQEVEPVGLRVRLGSEIRSEDGIIQYPDGVVKKTYLEGVKRSGDDITIEEVLQKVWTSLGPLSAWGVLIVR